MNNCCTNLKIKQKHYKKYFYCSKAKKMIDIECCKHCAFKEYKKKKVKKDYNDLSIFPYSLTIDCSSKSEFKEITVYNNKIIGFEKHHIFGGSDRNNSERYGLFGWVSKSDHKFLTDHPLENEMLQIKAQLYFENKFGYELFVKLFHPKYLSRKGD